jgi:hypothetical protein
MSYRFANGVSCWPVNSMLPTNWTVWNTVVNSILCGQNSILCRQAIVICNITIFKYESACERILLGMGLKEIFVCNWRSDCMKLFLYFYMLLFLSWVTFGLWNLISNPPNPTPAFVPFSYSILMQWYNNTKFPIIIQNFKFSSIHYSITEWN